MYTYHFPLKSISETTGIPLDTLKTWRQVKNRREHCVLTEMAHTRLKDDVGAQYDLAKECSIREYAAELGFDNPFKTGAPIPPTTLRQWEKDGDHQRVKMFLLGYQTQLLKNAIDKSINIFMLDLALAKKDITRTQIIRLIQADADATKALLSLLIHNK